MLLGTLNVAFTITVKLFFLSLYSSPTKGEGEVIFLAQYCIHAMPAWLEEQQEDKHTSIAGYFYCMNSL